MINTVYKRVDQQWLVRHGHFNQEELYDLRKKGWFRRQPKGWDDKN